MPFVLKIDSYAPVLKSLGQREEVETGTIIWIVVILLTLPLLLFLGNRLRIRMQRNRNLDLGYGHLEKLSTEKGLDYLEETTVERMAKAAKLQNPVHLLTSLAVFDRAVAIWMKNVRQIPWLEMEKQVEHLASIREKVGFRYLAPGAGAHHHPGTGARPEPLPSDRSPEGLPPVLNLRHRPGRPGPPHRTF